MREDAADGAGGRRRSADGGVFAVRQRLQPAGDHPRAALRAAAHSRRAKAPVAAQCGQAVDRGGRQRPAADV